MESILREVKQEMQSKGFMQEVLVKVIRPLDCTHTRPQCYIRNQDSSFTGFCSYGPDSEKVFGDSPYMYCKVRVWRDKKIEIVKLLPNLGW